VNEFPKILEASYQVNNMTLPTYFHA